jgi:2-succinyl-5-enolpyruvyl-6-hydroxy-3-cyclohexene-1-carboxylate synthase
VITTSGTAVGNLHPAVMEAHHSGVPIIVLSADRPEALRGLGSNQTTDQPGIFGTAVKHSWDIAAPTGAEGEIEAARQLAGAVFAKAHGPVHLNLSLAEPLSSAFAYEPPKTLTEPVSVADLPPAVAEQRGFELEQSPGTVVVAGAGAGPRAEEVARQLGAPLIAEVSSGAHFGPQLVVAYRELLATANFGDRVARVIVFGHPTLSREVPALIQRDGVQTIVVRGRAADDFNPGRRVAHFADAVTVIGEPSDRSWAGRWVSASRALIVPTESAPDAAADPATFARGELAAVRAPVTRRSLVEAVWQATWPHDRLVLAASRLIREADRFVVGKKISVHANRGLAGIDGTISTALGIALASQASAGPSTTRVLLGDLAFLHDAGALLFGADEEVPTIQVIVGNDGGGTIFDGLEVGRQGGAVFDRVLLTPQRAPIEQLARAYGWEYVRVETRGALDQALTASPGRTVIEVPLPRE